MLASIIDSIPALHETVRIDFRLDVLQLDVPAECAEQGDAISQQNGYARDGQFLDEPGTQKPLNGVPTIDVDVLGASFRQPLNDLGRRAGHDFHLPGQRRQDFWGADAEHHHPFAGVGPGVESEGKLVGVAPHDQGVDGIKEHLVAIIFARDGVFRPRQPVDGAVFTGNEAIQGGGNEYRASERHGHDPS